MHEERLKNDSFLADGNDRTFEVYKCCPTEPGFTDYFERLQMFVMFFVDAASLIDLEDDNWNYFIAYVAPANAFCVNFF